MSIASDEWYNRHHVLLHISISWFQKIRMINSRTLKSRDLLLESSCVNALMNYILQKWCLYCSRPKNCVTISPHSAKKGRKRRNTHTQSHNKGPCNTHTQYRRIGLFGQHYCIKKLEKNLKLNGSKNWQKSF